MDQFITDEEVDVAEISPNMEKAANHTNLSGHLDGTEAKSRLDISTLCSWVRYFKHFIYLPPFSLNCYFLSNTWAHLHQLLLKIPQTLFVGRLEGIV